MKRSTKILLGIGMGAGVAYVLYKIYQNYKAVQTIAESIKRGSGSDPELRAWVASLPAPTPENLRTLPPDPDRVWKNIYF